MAKDFDAAYEAMLANPPEHPYRYFYEAGAAYWEKRWVDLYEDAWAFLTATENIERIQEADTDWHAFPTYRHYQAMKKALKEAFKQ